MKNKRFALKVLMIIAGLILSISIVTIAGARFYAQRQLSLLSAVFYELKEKYPAEEQNILEVIKNNSDNSQDTDNPLLSDYGYDSRDFIKSYENILIFAVTAGISAIVVLIVLTIYIVNSHYKKRINELTEYLNKLNSDREVSIISKKNDNCAGLEDEIYKTVTYLKQMKEDAEIKQKNYADNLANIAHQMKTPLTSISLLSQDMQNGNKIVKQVDRLTGMEEALLLLSRIDAGTITLDRSKVDVYTMLQCSVDTLEELYSTKGIVVHLDNKEEISYWGDMEWSIEASINIIKNCIEFASSAVWIDYSVNALYVEILISDDGEGFNKNDIPHLFERFYTGKRSTKNGVGIGLALSKELFEMQNGIIEAFNSEKGGACYRVRIYSH